LNRQDAKSAKEKPGLAAQWQRANMGSSAAHDTQRQFVTDLLGALGVLAVKRVSP
jgi:hypothetical protein